MSVANQIIKRLKEAFEVKTNKELTDVLGLSESSLSNWQRRDLVPEKILLKCSQITSIDYDWLLTGDKKEVSHSVVGDNNVNIGNGNGNNVHINISQFDHKDDIKEIIELLKYAPSGFLDTVKDRLKQFKELSEI